MALQRKRTRVDYRLFDRAVDKAIKNHLGETYLSVSQMFRVPAIFLYYAFVRNLHRTYMSEMKGHRAFFLEFWEDPQYTLV